jgi:alpha-glucosidase
MSRAKHSLLALSLLLGAVSVARGQEIALASPDGSVQVAIGVKERPGSSPAGTRLFYSVRLAGADVLMDSPFELQPKGAPAFASGVTIQGVRRRTVSERWQRPWGKRKEVADHFNEVAFTLQERQAPRRRVELTFRAYDDGVALRYQLPASWGSFALQGERTGFAFAGEPTVWAANYGGFHSSQEQPFVSRPLAQLSADSVYGLPLLLKLAPTRWAAVTEAQLSDWAGMYLGRAAGERGTLVTRLAPRPDEADVVVRSTAPRASPWRVLLLGSSAGKLAESDLVQNLNPPPSGDFSWVQPGTASWDWWNGPYAPDVDFPVGMNTATIKYFVDFSAEMGWKYVLIDEGWYGPAFAPTAPGAPRVQHPTSRITNVLPALDLPEVIRYARERGVRPVLWLHWGHVAEQMEEAFPLFEKWGVAGVKIDFMDRDDQEMVGFYHRVAELAAKHHLMVDFHGAYKPTGESRTYPNLVTREGVMGNEYNKWSALVTPEHTVTLPFTRGLLGEMDFTPGGFRNKTVRDFRPVNLAPMVMGTRVHQLAMFVVYESVFRVASDSPYNYRSSPAGLDLLKVLPVTWDDTRVLAGEPGDFITMARRSGDDWWVASMGDEQRRTLQIPLGFLPAGSYRAEIWADDYGAAEFPDRLMKQARTVTAADTLAAVMAPAGGHIVRLTPAR